MLLGDAVAEGIIIVNPARVLEQQRRRKRPDSLSKQDRQKSIRPMSLDQLATFLAVAQVRCSRRDWTLFLAIADAGLRPGEALALRWEDLDSRGRTLSVERAVSEGLVKTTKTETSRSVDVTSRLAAALTALQANVEADALVGGSEPSPWIFPTSSGTLLDQHNLARLFRSVLRSAQLPRHHRLYDLRHTFGSHLLAQGAPITYVAAQLGHAKPTTTLAHYAHWIPNGDKAYIDRLETFRTAAVASVPPVIPDDVGVLDRHATAIEVSLDVSAEDLNRDSCTKLAPKAAPPLPMTWKWPI